MADWVQSVAPVATLILGWGLSQLGDERKERRQAQRQTLSSLAERRAAFQRETLLALQEAMERLGRATGRIHYEDKLAFRKTGSWGNQAVSEEWSERQREASLETDKLRVRVEDDELRSLIETFASLCTDVGGTTSEDQSLELLVQVITAHEAATQRLGVLLRTVY